ncbi:MAG: DUF308 domain-containing protein [Eubacteriales bacterium]|nr:DUF308 domain-containing protein [Eubacteriales bacterium]
MSSKKKQKEMWEKAKKIKTNRVIATLIGIILGVVLLVWPESSLIVLCQAVGLALAFGGIVAVVLYFVNHDGLMFSTVQLVFGVILAAIGIWIFARPARLVELVPTIIGLIVMINGIVDLSQTVTLGRQKYDKWWVSLIFAILTLVLGIVLIVKPFGIAAFITRVIGVVLIFNGLSDLWMISKISNDIKQMRQVIEAVDVEATEVTEEDRKKSAAAREDEAFMRGDDLKSGSGTTPQA